MRAKTQRGYTLIELVVTVLIIGILTSIAVPQYLRTVEVGKADDAAATVNMVGTTNKMFALDHANTYVTGTFPAGAGATCASIGGPACPAVGPYAACALVYCKYLADQAWGDKPYTYTAGAGPTATAARSGGSAPYNGWGYSVSVSGVITAAGGAPPPTY